MTDARLFDPTIGELHYVIAANDIQRELIFPGLLNLLDQEGINLFTRFIPSGLPAADLLRRDRCQFLVTPFPPEGPDIYQVRLIEDRVVCFYDPNMRKAPKTLNEFLDSDLVDVQFDDNRSSLDILGHPIREKLRKPRVAVSNFNDVYPFLIGSTMLSMELSLMANLAYQGLQYAEPPFKLPPISMYLVWHRRNHTDPAHRWFRDKIQAFVGDRLMA